MTLDQQLDFIQAERANLLARPETWAAQKAAKFSEVAETLRNLRQERLMTSELTGKRITDHERGTPTHER